MKRTEGTIWQTTLIFLNYFLQLFKYKFHYKIVYQTYPSFDLFYQNAPFKNLLTSEQNARLNKRNDSLPPKYTTFHHLVYVVRWSPTLFYFLKIKKL
jgi:hypothetical protein